MKNISLHFLTIILFFYTNIQAQKNNNLSSLFIPQNLTENANAIVRHNDIVVSILASDKMVVTEKRIVTVLNKLGKTHVDAYKHYSDDTKIVKLTAIIYDAFGSKIKKYSKNDFNDISAISEGTLYSDSRIKFLEYTPTSYPYTVVIESEYKNSSTGFIPSWFPLENYYLAIEKSTYTINNPLKIPYRKREKNFQGYTIEKSSNENSLSYSLTNQKAIKYEKHTVGFEEFAPNLSISLNQFSLKGIKGVAKNWKEFGKWRYDFLKNGNDVVSESIKNKIQTLVKGVDHPIERAKIIYNYVQNKTRYISVQEDIGGWQPIAANEVDNVGYGDCKGLTNYTKALLDAANVKSHYSVVWAGQEKKNIYKYFSSMQGNHIILNIPNEGNDIWLECTSQTAPFGFLGSFTDDRDVLVITPEGGIIKRTPIYTDNIQTTTATINLLANGNINSSLTRKSYGTQYGKNYRIENYTQKELDLYYKSDVWDYNNNLEIASITLNNNKDKVEFTESIDVKIKGFATIRDNSYLFKLNVFDRATSIPKRYRNRQRKLAIKRGLTHKDEFIFKIPDGFTFSSLPQNKSITNKFGSYKISFKKLDDSSFQYNRVFSLKKGTHPKEDYKSYRKFRKTVSKYDNLRTELIKL